MTIKSKTMKNNTPRSNVTTRRAPTAGGGMSVRFMVATLAVFLAATGGIFLFTNIARAATYNFVQSSWIGGATTATSTHPGNQTNWTQYTSQTGTTATTTISLPFSAYAFTDDGATSTTPVAPNAKGGGFANGTVSGTTVSGSGTAASVLLSSTLTPANKWVTALEPVPGNSRQGSILLRNGADDTIYVTQGNNSTGFYKYSIAANTWTTLASTPGAIDFSATMIRNGADDTIYLTQAGTLTGFYKYSIAANSWTTLAPVPVGVYSGGSLIRNASDDTIYLTAGWYTASFYKYSIVGNSWTALAPVPGTLNVGSTMLRNGADDTIYVPQGNSGTGFYKYSIAGNTWTTLAPSPFSTGNGGSTIRNGADDAIYMTQGDAGAGFYKYSIAGNTWTTLAVTPAAIQGGASLIRNSADDAMYLTQGYNGAGFYKYSIASNTWTALATTPTAITFGSKMIRNGTDDAIYVTQGNSATGFYRYSIANNTWTSSTNSKYTAPNVIGPILRNGLDDNMYVFAGNDNSGFYRYSILGNTWTSLAAPPAVARYSATAIRSGAEDAIYFIPSNNTTAFYKYSIAGNSWTTLAPAPGPTNAVNGAIIRNGTEDAIYFIQGAAGAGFYKYSIAGNSWTTLTASPSSLYSEYPIIRSDGDDAIYARAGVGSTAFYKYSIVGNSWTTLTAAPGPLSHNGSFMIRNGNEDAIYVSAGGYTTTFYKYSIAGNSWTTLAAVPVGGGNGLSAGARMVRNGADDAIYLTSAQFSGNFYKYSIAGNSWTTLPTVNASLGWGANLLRSGADDSIFVSDGSTNALWRYLFNASVYATTGTFTSAPIDTGSPSGYTTMTYTKSTPAGTSLTIDVRSSPDTVTWTPWTTNVASGGSIAAVSGNRYFQYRANFSAADTSATPVLSDVTINYNQYSASGNLISSKYDTTDSTNTIGKLSWVATGTSTTETLKFQVRSSPDGNTWSNWCGPSTACLGTDYFQDADNGVPFAAGHPLKTGGNDRYLQYQAFLTGGGGGTPTVTSVTPQYIVNATPNFDATYGTNGTIVTQVATSTDPNWGKVTISYSVRDADTATGTATPGYVTPSFEYSTDGGTTWLAIAPAALAVGDTANKAVAAIAYNTYTATWTASTTVPNLYNATMKVRVSVNDNEGANNIAQAVSALFTLDTKPPAIPASGALLDSSVASSTGSLILTATDDSQFQYRYCNDNTFPASDTQGNSCAWSALGTNLASKATTWTPSAASTAPMTETVYLQIRDALGNMTAQTIVAPAIPTNFDFKDISNIGINVYREFLSWALFQNSTGSTFGGYRLYTSTDGATYSLLTDITNLQTNFYVDNITTATSSMHYYKVYEYDTLGNKSHYTSILSDVPNGTGGTDVTPPVITNVLVPAVNIKNTSAQVTFTTDKLTQATVQYRVSGTIPWSTYSNISYLKDQSVYITGLVPNTLYNIQVKAVDVYGNTSPTVAGPDFTTSGGPVITNVTVSSLNDISATIFWNTSTSSDSYVYYSQFASMASPGTAGSAVLVPCVAALCQHQVTVSGLTAGKQYYYYVKSTDGLGNMSTDTNTNNYYTFTTTLDTTPPVISGISTPVIAPKQAVVVWKTDELATSQVLYGPNTGDRSRSTVTDMTKSIYHVVTLSSETTNAGAAGGTNELAPTTKYYYVVKSADIAGNTATSPEQTFTTPNTGDVTIVAVSIVNTTTGAGTVTPDTTPPTISNIKATSIDSFDESISFITNKNTISFVDYGKDTSYGSNVGDPLSVTAHTTKLANLTMGTTYHYRIKVVDAAGNTTTSDDQTFKTPFLSEQKSTSTVPLDDATLLQSKIEDLVQSALPSLTAPFVTAPKVADITEHGATVTWTTNVKAYGLLGYATDDEYTLATSTYSSELSSGTGRQTKHTVALKNLKSNTKYHIQAKGYVFQDVIGRSDDVVFSTKPAQIQGSIAERTKDSFTVVWTTDEPASSVVEYKNNNTGITQRNSDETMRTAHSVKVDNLPSGETYTVNISGVNKEGNVLEAITPIIVTVPRDLIPPVISGFKVDNALVPGRTDRIQTIVAWKTDKPSDSVAYYEEGAGVPGETKELANKVSISGTYVQLHSVILPGLKPGTIYRVKVVSVDDSGNRASFGPRTIITPQQTQSITDVIFKNFEDSFKFLRNI